MSRSTHDSPYRDVPSSVAAPQPAQRAPRQGSKGHAVPAHSHSRNSSKERAEPQPRSRRRSKRGSRRGSPYGAAPQLTSLPTGRAAYADTRSWLLDQHGPVCAYCGQRFPVGTMTLDHVAPRRGRTAYDRRDNLVLACQGCNGAKRDLAPLAFLLGNRMRAANLLRYGSHLSPMLVELARQLAPTSPTSTTPSSREAIEIPELDDDESPYRD